MANHPNRNKYSSFQRWWLSVNKVLWARGLPEMNYGEARDAFQEYCSISRADGCEVS